jgi:acyl-CoA thioester hydrolase
MADDRFRYYLRVRYSDCDMQKVVFNVNYGHYISVATTEFLRALPGRDLVNGELDYQLVKQTIEWKAPARYDQVLEIAVSVSSLGTTSFTFATDFRIAGSEELIASAETVRVLMDAASMQKIAIPDDLRATLAKGAPGVVVDHAAYLSTDDIFFS